MSLAVILLLLGLILVGVPVGFSLMITATAMMYVADVNLMMIPVQMFAGTNAFPLLAIPLFILMGELMSATTISARLIDLASAMVGWIRGGLSHVNVVTNMFMAEMSGSGVADAAALSKIFVPEMARAGYPRAFAGAITSSAATLGIIIPPSIPMVLFGVTTNTSIRDLFIAGVLPGLLLAGGFMTANYLFARFGHYPVDRKFELQRLIDSLRRALVPLLIPVIVLGGIIGGVFTATEASGIGVAVALLFGMVISRDLTLPSLWKVLVQTAKQASVVMMLVAGSAVLGQFLANEQLPQKIAQMLGALADNPVLLLLVINVFLLFLGMVLHATATIIIVVPILMPLAAQMGLDPVHFGVIVCLNIGIGQQTPPVASIALTVSSITGLKIEEVLSYNKWFILVMIIVLMIVSYVPLTALWFRAF
jgi:tripartite ATP-independent transporter DctM subunit